MVLIAPAENGLVFRPVSLDRHFTRTHNRRIGTLEVTASCSRWGGGSVQIIYQQRRTSPCFDFRNGESCLIVALPTRAKWHAGILSTTAACSAKHWRIADCYRSALCLNCRVCTYSSSEFFIKNCIGRLGMSHFKTCKHFFQFCINCFKAISYLSPSNNATGTFYTSFFCEGSRARSSAIDVASASACFACCVHTSAWCALSSLKDTAPSRAVRVARRLAAAMK